jgi:Bacteriophage tail sheath protein
MGRLVVPITVSYPGVYIQEAPSTVHAITPVATSITAFVGRARRGTLNTPTSVSSWADFQRQFGDFWSPQSRLAFSVYDFFANGGSSATIVRLHHLSAKSTLADQDCATAELTTGVTLYATNPGSWGGQLTATVDTNTAPGSGTDVFNLTIVDGNQPGAAPQKYFNVNLDETASAGYLPTVLQSDPTALVNVLTPVSGTPAAPAAETISFAAPTGADGDALDETDFVTSTPRTGLNALDKTDLFNLLVIPPYKGSDQYTNPQDVDPTVIGAAATYCESRKAFLLVDALTTWQQPGEIGTIVSALQAGSSALGISGLSATTGTPIAANAAVFFPRLLETNLATGRTETFATGGAVAGVFAATDAQRGVWKAPAGVSASLGNVSDLAVPLTDSDNGQLNPLGMNCLRLKPSYGPVVWGARTLQGADAIGSQWKYIPVRRLALFLELSLYQGTQWVVFEPNDEPLWAQIRMNINSFMQNLFQQGAFQGSKPSEAYFVKCDNETTTQTDIDNGIVNIIVGFAPLLPAEFVVITLQQMAGQASS